MDDPEKKSNIPSNATTLLPKKVRFYRYKSFWLLFVGALYVSLMLGSSALLNRRVYQERAAAYLLNRHGVQLEFEDLHFQLLWGEISGKNILVDSNRKKYKISLNEFRLAFSPLWLMLGRLRLTSIDAKELFIDTSFVLPSENVNPDQRLPDFLRRIKLKHAHIENFAWKRKENAMLMFARMDIESKFGSIFVSSPTHMKVTGLTYTGEKFDIFVDHLEQNGFFVFDLTKPRFLDESRIHTSVTAVEILLALHKKHKYWLNDAGWDADLQIILEQRYGTAIPQDRSYVFAQKAAFSVESILNDIHLQEFMVELDGAQLVATGEWNPGRGVAQIHVQTAKPLRLSRLPLGQSKFRQSFDFVDVKLDVEGSLKSLDDNDLQISTVLKLQGNRVHPEAGDLQVLLKGQINNGNLISDHIVADIAGGTLNASGNVHLREKNLNVVFATKDFDLKTVMRMLSSLNYPSRVNANGKISGSLLYPDFNISFDTTNAAYEFLNFGPAQGKLNIHEKNLDLTVNSSSILQGSSKLTLKVENLYDSLHQNLELKTEHADVDIAALLASKSMAGNISGKFRLSRRGLATVGDGAFTAPRFIFYGHEIGSIDAKVNLKDRHLLVSPLLIRVKDPDTQIQAKNGMVFDFDDLGYTFQGGLGDFLKISGQFRKGSREWLGLKMTLSRFPVHILATLFPFKIKESSISATVDLNYNMLSPLLSTMKSQISALVLNMSDGRLNLSRATTAEYRQKAFWLHQAAVDFFSGHLVLDGAIGMENNSALHIKGGLDFNGLADINPVIVDSEKSAEVDLTLKENIHKPKIYGKVFLKNDSITFRRLPGDLARMYGTVLFDGDRISSADLKMDYDDAPIQLSGWAETDWQKIVAADMKLVAADFPLHLEDNLDLVTDLNISLSGASPLRLSGKANITDGEFKRDFGITNFILKPESQRRGAATTDGSTRFGALPGETLYDISIHNTGDFIVKNNIALIEMAADLQLVGSLDVPALSGQVDFTNGTINAFGVSFSQATGSAQFMRKNGLNPLIDLTAKKDIDEYEITAKILGPSENLRLGLDSTPSLDRREILSMIFYGRSPDELTREARRQFTQAIAVSQLANILSQPVNNVTGLDVLKVSSRQETVNDTVQRLSVGKRVSNRFSLAFTTDLGVSNPERAVELEFQVFDNLYLIAAKDLGQTNRFRFNMNYRFELE